MTHIPSPNEHSNQFLLHVQFPLNRINSLSTLDTNVATNTKKSSDQNKWFLCHREKLFKTVDL